MPIIEKTFTGKMNSDVSEFRLPEGDYLYAMNLRIGSSDGQNIGTVTNVKNNKVIAIDSSLQYLFDDAGGTVKIKTIGTGVAEDAKKVFWFVYRSDNLDFILEYDSQSEQVSKILINLDDTNNVDVTHFSLRYPIFSVNLVDETYLKWTDGKIAPGSIDIVKFKAGTYGIILEEYIRAAKAPSLSIPTVSYVSTPGDTFNRLKKNLFQFQSLLVYDGNERSVYSPMSHRPIPANEPTPTNDLNPDINNGISVTFDIGGLNVKSIELTARTNVNDWFLVNVFDKQTITQLDQFGNPLDPGYSAVDNTYTFTFYNDGNYNNVDASEQILYFDYLPDIARTQEYASGSMVYAGITEGYNAVDVSGIVYPVYGSTSVEGSSIYTWKTNSKYQFGLVYFNSKTGKSGTVNNISTFDVVIKPFWGAAYFSFPTMAWSILHNPPIWADKYQWVRTNQLTHEFFLFWVARTVISVVQDSASYYDLYIDTLESFNRSNEGSILSYDFAPGDRVTVHRLGTTDLAVAPYDVEIVEFQVYTPQTEPVTIPSPVYRLRIKQNSDIGDVIDGALIEIYRPKLPNPSGENVNVFYEFDQVYDITNPGTDSATHSVTDGAFPEGDVFLRSRLIPTEAPNDDVTHVYTTSVEVLEDPGFSDYYLSTYSSNGRPNLVDKNNRQIESIARYRFSETFIPNTQINGLSRFYPASYIDYDVKYGPVQRIELRDNYIISFQQLKVGAIPIFATVVEQQTGVDQLVLSETLLNKVRYYFGDYGISDFPEALARNDGVMYFVDASRGVVLRLDGSGLNPISQEASMDNFFNSLLKQYARGNQKINGGFEKRFNEYVLSFENEDVVIFDGSDTEDSAWDNSRPVNRVDRSTISIVSGPSHGTASLIEPGVLRYHSDGSTGEDIVVYGADDISGNALPDKNLCINVIPDPGGLVWTGVNPKCFTVMGVLHKYYLNRQLYNNDGSGPYLCNGLPIIQENYNPVDPGPSLADPDYVADVEDDCFCSNDCPDGNDNFINNTLYHFIIDEGEPTAYVLAPGETHRWTFDGQTYFTIRATDSGSSSIAVFQYDCHVGAGGPIFHITNTFVTYHIAVFAGNTIYLGFDGDTPPTC